MNKYIISMYIFLAFIISYSIINIWIKYMLFIKEKRYKTSKINIIYDYDIVNFFIF